MIGTASYLHTCFSYHFFCNFGIVLSLSRSCFSPKIGVEDIFVAPQYLQVDLSAVESSPQVSNRIP